MSIPILTDQVEKGLYRLIFDFQEKENIEKLFTLFLKQVQDLEEANFSTMQQRGIYEAIGFQLDLIGKIVGLERKGRDDEEYRSSLLFKIGVNTSDGTPDKIISLIKEYTEATTTRMTEHFPASFVLTTNGKSRISGELAYLLGQLKSAGVRATIASDFNDDSLIPLWTISSSIATFLEATLPSDDVEMLEFEDGSFAVATLGGEYLTSGTDTDRAVKGWIEYENLTFLDLSPVQLITGETLQVINNTPDNPSYSRPKEWIVTQQHIPST